MERRGGLFPQFVQRQKETEKQCQKKDGVAIEVLKMLNVEITGMLADATTYVAGWKRKVAELAKNEDRAR